MNDQSHHAGTPGVSPGATPTPHFRFHSPGFSRQWLRPDRWLPALMAAIFWLVLVYGLPLHTLRESRRIAKVELTNLLRTDRPDTPTVLDAFDRATEQVLFSVSGPYFILAVAALFFVAHLVVLKRRLRTVERKIQSLRDAILGIDGVPLK